MSFKNFILLWASLAIMSTVCVSCGPNAANDSLNEVLSQSGSNRAELQRVLDHYRKAGDTAKLSAAEFLIAHMPGLETQSFGLFTQAGEQADFPLYRDDITNENFTRKLDSLGLRPLPYITSDLETIKADYLIRNIDLAFEAWQGNSWSQGYTEELFREYILPHRIDTEDLSDWRTFFVERYRPMIDTMTAPKTVRNVASLIIKEVNSWLVFSYDALMLKPAMTPAEAYGHGLGECNNIADIFVLALRAMGIAATKDVIPVWGSSYGGHAEAMYFDELGQPVLVSTGNPLGASPVRVYRTRYSLGPACDAVADDPRYEDVTAQYVAVSDISLVILLPELHASTAPASGFVALAVYNNEGWRPAVSSLGMREGYAVSGDSATVYDFRGISRGVIYRPVRMNSLGAMEPVGDPACLDARGNVSYMVADTAHRVDMDLTYAATPAQQTMLIRPQDGAAFVPADYKLLYWSEGHWAEHPQPIIHSRGKDGQPALVIRGVPSGTFYRLVDRHTGKTFRNRPFTLWRDRFERY